ncbi:BAG family molecular chaperone regulator 7-like [Phragmites australis]|uniref:BAG family molecular chaperone regulator 7-like n=1 Tax=Phragmites australis TaxID=29695 RepID=UPI002D7866D6|nr:BAG family molecular chaperone regulator 7-like [Phragmites australis]
MSRDHFLRLLQDPFPPFPTSSSSCPFAPSASSTHHRFLLDDHPFFPSPTSFSSCPLGFASPIDTFHLELDLLLPSATPAPPCPALDRFLLDALGHRVSALERARAPPAPRRKYTYAAEANGRKVKWTAEDKPAGGRNLKWEAELKTPHDDGFDRKWKWESKASADGATKVKWAKEVKGKGWLEPWSHAYSVEEAYGEDDHEQKTAAKKADKKVKEEEENGKKKGAVEIVQIEDNTAGCVAIRKAFERIHGKGKRKELSAHDAALLIQMTYRAHLAHRSQVLRCLRDLAVAKAKLKEIRSLFYNISYRRRIAHDSEERQRFAEKIIVLLLTVDALEGPDYMVRNAKRSMLDELEGMLEIVDPQPPGKPRTLSRRKFDLPEGGAIPKEMRNGVKNVIKIVEEGK